MPSQKKSQSKNLPVSKVYDQIAESFDSKRRYPWRDVTEFIATIKQTSFTLGLGSGNGRHTRLLLAKDIDATCIDISYNILKTALENELAPVRHALSGSINADIVKLPFRDTSFDNIITIAVFHHLDTDLKRKQALAEIVRILKKGGRVLLSCWLRTHSRFKKDDLKEEIAQGKKDILVPWKLSETEQILRYYYLFEIEELEQLLQDAQLTIQSSIVSYHNVFIIAQK